MPSINALIIYLSSDPKTDRTAAWHIPMRQSPDRSGIVDRARKTVHRTFLYKLPVRSVYTLGGLSIEEELCNVEIVRDNNDFVIKIQSDLGGVREYRSSSFEEVLEQLMQDLQEEFETL